jgi:hypothetical protein
MKTRVAVNLSTIGAGLGIYAFIVALLIHPPPPGWVGFAIVSIIVLGLGALAPLAFERTRVSPQRPAATGDARKRLLVIADSHSARPPSALRSSHAFTVTLPYTLLCPYASPISTT